MSHMPALTNPTQIDVTALEARVTALEAGGSGTPNLYTADSFLFTDDWTYGALITFANSGNNPVNYGIYTTDWTNNASIGPITGSGRLGLTALSTGVLTDARCRVRTGAMGAFDSTKYASISFEAIVAFGNKATVTDDYTAEIGLVGNKWLATDSLGDVAGFMHAFRYKRSVGGHKWMVVNRNLDVENVVILDGTTNGTTTAVATVDGGTIDDLALPAYSFFRLKVIATANPSTGAGTSAAYYVNDVLCATITTNMVTHSLAGSVDIRKTAGTNSRYLALDYTALGYTMRTGQDRLP
jgi:hypothetical protein